MKFQNLKNKAKTALAAATVAVLSAPAMAEESNLLQTATTEISGLKTGIIAFGVVIVGIAIAMATISIVKRAINKA